MRAFLCRADPARVGDDSVGTARHRCDSRQQGPASPAATRCGIFDPHRPRRADEQPAQRFRGGAGDAGGARPRRPSRATCADRRPRHGVYAARGAGGLWPRGADRCLRTRSGRGGVGARPDGGPAWLEPRGSSRKNRGGGCHRSHPCETVRLGRCSSRCRQRPRGNDSMPATTGSIRPPASRRRAIRCGRAAFSPSGPPRRMRLLRSACERPVSPCGRNACAPTRASAARRTRSGLRDGRRSYASGLKPSCDARLRRRLSSVMNVAPVRRLDTRRWAST